MPTKLLTTLAILATFVNLCDASGEKNHPLSRRKRYLVFPEGSSVSIAICLTSQMGITPGELFTEGINWGISYELPNDTKEFLRDFKKPEQAVRRRNRRELYGKIEKILNSMGYDGKSCVSRAICEAAQFFKPRSGSVYDAILRTVFNFPDRKVLPSEKRQESESGAYFRARKLGRDKATDCAENFPCAFSLIGMALGYYSQTFEPGG